MKKVLKEYKGVVLFYLLIILSILVINANNNQLNTKASIDNNTIAVLKNN